MSTAVVTGGSAGIGRAIARRLLDAGYEVVSLDVQPSGLAHTKLKHVHVDLADAEATQCLDRQHRSSQRLLAAEAIMPGYGEGALWKQVIEVLVEGFDRVQIRLGQCV